MPPLKVLPPDEVNRHMRDLVETTSYADPDTGERYDPDELPTVNDPEADADER